MNDFHSQFSHLVSVAHHYGYTSYEFIDIGIMVIIINCYRCISLMLSTYTHLYPNSKTLDKLLFVLGLQIVI